MINRCVLLWLVAFFISVFLLITFGLVMFISAVNGKEYRPGLFPVWHSVPETSYYEMSLMAYDNDYVMAMFLFFVSGTALVMFRLFRRNVFTIISHGLMHLSVLYSLVYRIFMPFENVQSNFVCDFPIPFYILIGFYAIQCTLAPFMVFFRRNRSHKVRKTYRQFHAFLGLLTYAIVVWTFILQTSKLSFNYAHVKNRHVLAEPWIFSLLGQVFLLIVLFVLFMPVYEKVRNRRAVTANVELPHTVNRGTTPQVVTIPYTH